MHIDLNAFFATAECIRNPSLIGKPVIVGGLTSRGVVSTCSYEARAYGVHSAMPIFKAKELCPDGVFLSGDYHYYEMLSRSFFSYIYSFSPIIEEASIDECFVDMTKPLSSVDDPISYLENLRDGLFKELGLKCSIGIGPTKFLAKMASDMKKPMGITIIRKKDIPNMLYPLKIGDFFGIGKKSVPRLNLIGIYTIGDLANKIATDEQIVKIHFGKFYDHVKSCLLGTSSDIVDTNPWDPKSLGHSRTFPFDTDDEYIIESKIRELAFSVSEGAKREKKKGKTIQITVKDTSFHNHNKSISFRDPTDDCEFITNKAIELYEKYFLGQTIRLVGVTLQNLIDPKDSDIQMSLWNYEEYEKEDETRLLISELNRKMKKPKLMRAKEAKKNGDGHK